MSDLPHEFREAAFSPSTPEAVITLLILDHAAWAAPLRLSDYPSRRLTADPFVQVTTHDAVDYTFAIVSVAAAGADAGALPESTIVIQNLEGEYDYLDEEEIEDMTVEVIEVLKSDPDIVIRRFDNFVLSEVSPGEDTLTLTLGLEHVQEERFPTHGISKSRAPGLFPV